MVKTPWGSASSTPGAPAKSTTCPTVAIPDHALIRRIGRGAYGEVWLAKNALGVYRAVKILHRRAFADDRPFEREFAGIQRFEPISRSHESQLNILHVGRGPDSFYYVMELADDMGRGVPTSSEGATAGPAPGKESLNEDTYTAKTLRSELAFRGRLPVEECVRLGLALTTALGHLHRHGLVHRDIKPSNIVFVNGIPKLADIGLVALAERTMSFVGTEGYLPPEGPGTPQADLFSLGKVLYEISTGHDRQQFPELPTGVEALPDRAALTELNEVLLRACAPDPHSRYQTAAEMHADLALLQSGKSVARLRTVERRLQFLARAGALVTVLAALAGGAFFYQQYQTREARRLASENRELAGEKSRLADEKSALAEVNRDRIVRLDIANGVRLLDEGDPSGALLWFADALPLVADRPKEASIHRIRIQQVMNQLPPLLRVFHHDSAVTASAFAPDGRRVVTGTMEGLVQVWDLDRQSPLWPPREMGSVVLQARFTLDGRRLLISSSPPLECGANGRPAANFAAVLDATTGRPMLPPVSADLVWSTFSPDGRWLAAAMADHSVQLLDTGDGRGVCQLTGHRDEVTRCSFSADGTVLASAGLDHTVRLWRLPSGAPIGQPLEHDRPVGRVILSDDGLRVATATIPSSGGTGCLVQVWDTQTGNKIGNPILDRDFFTGLFFDRSGSNRLFVAGSDPQVEVWEPDAPSRKPSTLPMKGILACWSFSPDGGWIAVGSDDQVARIWNVDNRELQFPPFRHTGWVQSLGFSQDGSKLVTGGNEGTAKVWGLGIQRETAKVQLAGRLPEDFPERVFRETTPHQGPLPVFYQDGTVCLLDPQTLEGAHRLEPSKQAAKPNRCVTSPSAQQWAIFYRERNTAASGAPNDFQASGIVDLWQEKEGQLHHLSLADQAGVQEVSFSPGEDSLIIARAGGWVEVWKTTDGTRDRAIALPVREGQVLCFSQDAKRALVFLERRRVLKVRDILQVFELATGRPLSEPFECPGIGEDFAFDLSGNRVATANQDTYVRVFDALTGKLLSPPFKHADSLLSVEWSPDGKLLLAAGLGMEATASDAATGEQFLAPFQSGTRGRIARWSADGRFVVTRNDDGFARVWDATTTEAVTPLLAHHGVVRLAWVSPQQRLITLSDPDTVRAWDLKETSLAPSLLMDYAKLLSGRELSANGVMLPLKPVEMRERIDSLRKHAPQLFAE